MQEDSRGFQAALYAIELLGLEADEKGCISGDEELVCIAENDACGIDAIQVILGCSVGKGKPFIPHKRETGIFFL